MDDPKFKVLSPGDPSNIQPDVGSIGEGEEDRLAQDTFIFSILNGSIGTKLVNGWILPSSSFPEQPYCQGRQGVLTWVGGRWYFLNWYPQTLGPEEGWESWERETHQRQIWNWVPK